MSDQKIVVPDIGDFDQVDVIEVLVSPGDAVQAEDSLITLESDKATMEIPSPQAGMVREIHVSPGDKVSQGSAILTLDIGASSDAEPPQQTRREPSAREEEKEEEKSGVNEQNNPQSAGKSASRAEVVVIGAGPGGYTAAFRAADLGKRVTLIERYPTLGGVCLNVGCIPSKALLHVAGLLGAVDDLAAQGVRFGAPEIELDTLRKWKTGVVKRLTDGLDQLAARRKVTVVQGTAKFVSAHALEIDTDEGVQLLEFDHAIIAAGSQPSRLPFMPYDDPRVMDSTDALRLESIPDRLLVIGGGIIGLEMASVFDALGSKVTVVELSDSLMPGCDPDLLRPLTKRIERRYENIFRNTRVVAVDAQEDGLEVRFEGEDAPSADRFDAILVAVGRRPNGPAIAAEAAGVHVDDNGFIPVDEQQRTNVPHILAIGDIVGEPQLAHKATHQGKVAAGCIAGQRTAFDARAIPAVAYTDPEVAWVGMTETLARQNDTDVKKAVFPWAASGRALAMSREEGFTKLLFDAEDGRLVGAGIVGPHAGDLIAETVLALEMGADAADISLSIHPHPTLSETISAAAEIIEGTITDLYLPRK